jgi:hypothetical protein
VILDRAKIEPRRRVECVAAYCRYQHAVPRAAIAERLFVPKTPALVRQHVERLRDAMTANGWLQAIRSLFTVYTPEIIPANQAPRCSTLRRPRSGRA